MKFKIGVDGGGTKTECILVDDAGRVVASHTAGGCNPSVVGAQAAASILNAAFVALRGSAAATVAQAAGRAVPERLFITDTLLCMAGSRGFWTDFAAGLEDFGRVQAGDDSRPILELATSGEPGLALHAGTGSFVAARAPDGGVHYAGGRGWRFGDPASGYDLGARAIGRALLEVQGWAPASGVSPAVIAHAQLRAPVDGSAITRHYYSHADATPHVAALAPALLRLAAEGDAAAQSIVLESAGGLLDLALTVATKLFPGAQRKTVTAGLSGPILNHPFVKSALAARSPMSLTSITDAPIEGVRQILMKV